MKTAAIAAGWYIEAGKGMGDTLTMANEKGAYTLADEGTFLAVKSGKDLVPIIDTGSILLNVYSVIVCTKSTKQTEAQWMVDFLVSDEVQDILAEYGKATYEKPLFIPCAGEAEPTS